MPDLHDLMPGNDTLKKVVEELRHGELRIGVFGEFSAGKSTFLNALMGEDLLSVAVEPTQATPTRIVWARDFQIIVYGKSTSDTPPKELTRLFPDNQIPTWARFVGKDGFLPTIKREQAQIRAFLSRWTKEGEDAARTSAVELQLPQPFLKERLCLIDTPGANNEFTRHQKIIEQVSSQVDLAICLLDARQGGKKTELDFVATIAVIAPLTILVVNKIDCVDPEERDDVASGLVDALRSRWPTNKGPCPEARSCSALAALNAEICKKHPDLAKGFDKLRHELTELVKSERGRLILHRTGGVDKILRTIADDAVRQRQLDIANRAYTECQSLYQEASINDNHLNDQASRVEAAMKIVISEANKAHELVDQAQKLLDLSHGTTTPEIREKLLQATLIFRKLNQRDERLELLQKQLEESTQKQVKRIDKKSKTDSQEALDALGNDVVVFERELNDRTTEYALEEFIDWYVEHNSSQLSLWEQAADLGIPIACVFWGSYLAYGQTNNNNWIEAINWFRKAAEQEYVHGQFLLGLCYYFGDGVAIEDQQAFSWFRKSAEQNDPWAQYYLGLCYKDGIGVDQNQIQAVEWLRKAAKQENAKAQCWLGVCYRDGIGVPKNPKSAVEWFQKAAEGDAEAQCCLGICYLHGTGVARDHHHAFQLIEMAAELGYDKAQYGLGVCYQDGIGTDKDLEQAKEWFEKAAEQGHAEAINSLKSLARNYQISPEAANEFSSNDIRHTNLEDKRSHEQQKPAQVTDQINQFNRAKKLVASGDIEGQYLVGMCYRNGTGVKQDDEIAVQHFKRAAEKGYALAQVWLGIHYRDGIGVNQDQAYAVEWFRKAAEQGDIDGQCYLGTCYLHGTGVPQNYQLAIHWLQKAAEHGHADAKKTLKTLWQDYHKEKKNVMKS